MIKHFFIVLFFSFLLFLFYLIKIKEQISPVFLIPGDGGSKLYAKVNRTHQPHFFCRSSSNYYLLWLSPFDFLPFYDLCYHYNIELRWNNSTPLNQSGTDVITGVFGDPSSVEYLDDAFPFSRFTGYFDKIIIRLTEQQYVRNLNLFATPFDFRLALDNFDPLMQKTKKLIEQNFRGTPVTLLAHSYGCIVATHFLTQQSLSWRKKYIKRFISTSGPYKGSVNTLKAILVGLNFDVHFDEDFVFRETLRTFPSTFMLFPTEGDLVKVGDRSNFTYEEIISLLNGENEPAMMEMFKMYQNTLGSLHIPEDVELFCIFSTGVKTISKFIYPDLNHFPSHPNMTYTDGDGTVGLGSLKECGRRHPWATVKSLDGVGHRAILKDPRVIDYIDKILK